MTKNKGLGNTKKTTQERLAIKEFQTKISSDRAGRYLDSWGAAIKRKVLWEEVCLRLNCPMHRNPSTLWRYAKASKKETPSPLPNSALSLDSSLTKTDNDESMSPAESEPVEKNMESPLLKMTKQLAVLSGNYHKAVESHQEAMKKLKACEENMLACRSACEKAVAEFMSCSNEVSVHEAFTGLVNSEQ